MGKTRTPHSTEFRVQTVGPVKAGRTPQELAREF
jgi:transposase